jgi:hypothetical protein
VGTGTIPAYVRRDDTSADDHKWVDLRGGRDALCSSAPDKYKLHTSIFKSMNLI